MCIHVHYATLLGSRRCMSTPCAWTLLGSFCMQHLAHVTHGVYTVCRVGQHMSWHLLAATAWRIRHTSPRSLQLLHQANNDLCYLCCPAAPQYGSAKDVINLAGMVASNVLRGDHPVTNWDTLDWQQLRGDPGAMIVDVREVSGSKG